MPAQIMDRVPSNQIKSNQIKSNILFYKCLQRFSLLILPTGTAQMTAILTKPSWSPKLSNGVVIVMKTKHKYFGENLQFSFKTEGFQTHYSFGKTFSFSSKQKEVQIVQLS
jgi:hypothetical protein